MEERKREHPKPDELPRGLIFNLTKRRALEAIRWAVYMQETGMGQRAWIYLLRFANESITMNHGMISSFIMTQFYLWNQKMIGGDKIGAVKCIKSAVLHLVAQPPSDLCKSANSTFALSNRGYIEESDWKAKLSIGDNLQRTLRGWIRGHKPMVRKCFYSFIHSVWNKDELGSLRLMTIAYQLGYSHYIWILIYLLSKKIENSGWIPLHVLRKHKEWLISSCILNINQVKNEDGDETYIVPWYIKNILEDGKGRMGIDKNLLGGKIPITWKINTDHFRICNTSDIIDSMPIVVRCIMDIINDIKPLAVDELASSSVVVYETPEELLKSALDTSKFYEIDGPYVDCFTERGKGTYGRDYRTLLSVSSTIGEKMFDDPHDYKRASIDFRLREESMDSKCFTDWDIYVKRVKNGILTLGEDESDICLNFKKSTIDPKLFAYEDEEEEQIIEPITKRYFAPLFGVLKNNILGNDAMISVLLDFIAIRVVIGYPLSDKIKVFQRMIEKVPYLNLSTESMVPILLSERGGKMKEKEETNMTIFDHKEDEQMFKHVLQTYIDKSGYSKDITGLFGHLEEQLWQFIPEWGKDRISFAQIYVGYINQIYESKINNNNKGRKRKKKEREK